MSAADELRTAASILRENAEGATPGPWGWNPATPGNLGPQHDASLTWPFGYLTSGDDVRIRDAVYITTMDPIVGAALAALTLAASPASAAVRSRRSSPSTSCTAACTCSATTMTRMPTARRCGRCSAR